MATSAINLPVSSKGLPVTLLEPSYFEIVQSSVREIGKHAIVGCLFLKCIKDWNSNDCIFTLGTTGVTIPAYVFLLAGVSASEWNGAVIRTTRFYYNTDGRINSNTSYSAGEYITVEFNVGL